LKALDERRRSLAEEVEDDVAMLRPLSLEERGKILESVCRDAMAILRARPDSESALQQRDPRSPEALALWQSLVDRYRHGRD
jgi:hypothetical protein